MTLKPVSILSTEENEIVECPQNKWGLILESLKDGTITPQCGMFCVREGLKGYEYRLMGNDKIITFSSRAKAEKAAKILTQRHDTYNFSFKKIP